MEAKDYLKMLCEDFHSVIMATVDENGLPHTRAIDLMLHDEKGLYFLTAKGKAFYEQLSRDPHIAFTGMSHGEGTMNKRAISFSGTVRNIGIERLDEIFRKNPYMSEIYPTVESRRALEVFCIAEGEGDYFDLSTKPISRDRFFLGVETEVLFPYQITDRCIECGMCLTVCPQDCIEEGIPFTICQEHCLHCGNCYGVCPVGAVKKQ